MEIFLYQEVKKMLTKNEKLFLIDKVKQTLKEFKENKETIIDQIPFKFFKSELEYEGFLKDLLKKLEQDG